MSEREDFLWQRFFAACSFLFVVFTFVGLEVFWPQPPSFALSADQTAAYYVEHQTGFFVGIVMCIIGMAFLLAWTAVRLDAVAAGGRIACGHSRHPGEPGPIRSCRVPSERDEFGRHSCPE